MSERRARRVLVTGGAGFIGTRLSRRLALRGDDVVVVDSLHPQVHVSGDWPEALEPVTARIRGDVTDPAVWDDLLAETDPDVVVHLAAETGTGQSLAQASRHGSANVVGTTQLLDGLSRHGRVPTGFVLASSRAVYGEGRWCDAAGLACYPPPRDPAALRAGRWDPLVEPGPARPLPHDAATTEPRPTNVYAATKLAQEHLLAAWTAAHGCGLRVLRLQNVYGPGQTPHNPYTGIVALFARLALAGTPADVFEDGNILRDLVHVDDVVGALATATDAVVDGAHDVVDIGGGEPVTLLDLAERLALLTGAPRPRVTEAFRPGDVRAAHADPAGAAARLGYRPSVDLGVGLAGLLDWVAAQPGIVVSQAADAAAGR